MAFTLPNVAVAAFPDQSEPDSVDIDILTAGHSITGVVSGCAVTPQGSPDMTVAVASGTVSVLGVNAAVTSGNVTITAAHGSLPRKDLVVASSAGAKSVVTGTAAAQPLKPAVPASSVALAEVYVPAADTAIQGNQITDKRVIVLQATQTIMRLIARKTSDQSVTSSTTFVDDTALVLPVLANEIWQAVFFILYDGSTAGDLKVSFSFPAGGSLQTYVAHLNSADGVAIGSFALTASDSSSHSLGAGGAGVVRAVPINVLYVNGSTGGNVIFRWAQVTSSGTATKVLTNSTVCGVKLA